MVVAGNSDKGLTLQYAPAWRTLPSAIIAFRAPQHCCPSRPTDVLAPRRRSHPSSQTASAASRTVGFGRLGVRSSVPPARRAPAPIAAGSVRILSCARCSLPSRCCYYPG